MRLFIVIVTLIGCRSNLFQLTFVQISNLFYGSDNAVCGLNSFIKQVARNKSYFSLYFLIQWKEANILHGVKCDSN
jgi:hypothetical protein